MPIWDQMIIAVTMRSWGEHGARDAVNRFAGTIDEHARRIENAITEAPAAAATA